MKISEIKKQLAQRMVLLESMSLGDVKKNIIRGTLKVDPSEQEWFDDEQNKQLLTDLITQFNVSKNLKNFDTRPFVRNKLFYPKKLMDAIQLQLSEEESRSGINTGSSDEYDMVEIRPDIKVYAVYTPKANTKLAYKGVVKGRDPYPTWCIASPTSGAMHWTSYGLWESKYPCVYLVVKEGLTKNATLYDKQHKPIVGNAYNLRYELRGGIDLDNDWVDLENDFFNWQIDLWDYIAEWRNATQEEESFDSSTIFDNMDITVDDLAIAIHKLMERSVERDFANTFGKNQFNKIADTLSKITDPNNPERQAAIITACKTGIINKWGFLEKLNKDEFEYVGEQCLKANTMGLILFRDIKDNLSKELAFKLLSANPDYLTFGNISQFYADNFGKKLQPNGKTILESALTDASVLHQVRSLLPMIMKLQPTLLDKADNKILEVAEGASISALNSLLVTYRDLTGEYPQYAESYPAIIKKLMAHGYYAPYMLSSLLQEKKFDLAEEVADQAIAYIGKDDSDDYELLTSLYEIATDSKYGYFKLEEVLTCYLKNIFSIGKRFMNQILRSRSAIRTLKNRKEIFLPHFADILTVVFSARQIARYNDDKLTEYNGILLRLYIFYRNTLNAGQMGFMKTLRDTFHYTPIQVGTLIENATEHRSYILAKYGVNPALYFEFFKNFIKQFLIKDGLFVGQPAEFIEEVLGEVVKLFAYDKASEKANAEFISSVEKALYGANRNKMPDNNQNNKNRINLDDNQKSAIQKFDNEYDPEEENVPNAPLQINHGLDEDNL